MFKNLSKIAFVIVSILLISCVASAQRTKKSQEPEVIPQNFNNKEYVLLIKKETSGMYKGLYNRQKEDACKKYFTGKIELVEENEVDHEDGKYNTSVYRFMLVENNHSKEFTYANRNGAGTRTNTHVTFDYNIYDRVTKQSINLRVGGASWKKAFERAIKKLNTYYINQ